MSSNSKDERSPSPDGSASPDIRHQKPRLKSRSPPKRSQSGSPSLDGSASPDISHQKPRSKSRSPPKRSQSGSPSPDGSASPDIRHQKPRSKSRSPPPKRSQLGSPEDEDVSNPGNNLYVTGLSTRVNSNDLQTFFSKEGKVLECCLVTDPRTKESRGFAFITMETREQADRCIKHLNRSVLEGRLVTVEKAKRARGRTPTPGRYEGLRKERGGPVGRGRGRGQGQGQGRRRSPSYSPRRRLDREHHYRDPHPRDRGARSRSPYGRRADDYSNSYRRHRERSSGGRSGYH